MKGQVIVEVIPEIPNQLTIDIQKYNLSAGQYFVKYSHGMSQITKPIILE